MPRHSKNNCARPVFTAWEKANTHEWGSTARRLTSDSQKPFQACTLCLHDAVIPMADYQGKKLPLLALPEAPIRSLPPARRRHSLALFVLALSFCFCFSSSNDIQIPYVYLEIFSMSPRRRRSLFSPSFSFLFPRATLDFLSFSSARSLGHIYCKQCIYEYLLDQKNQYSIKKKEYEAYKAKLEVNSFLSSSASFRSLFHLLSVASSLHSIFSP